MNADNQIINPATLINLMDLQYNVPPVKKYFINFVYLIKVLIILFVLLVHDSVLYTFQFNCVY